MDGIASFAKVVVGCATAEGNLTYRLQFSFIVCFIKNAYFILWKNLIQFCFSSLLSRNKYRMSKVVHYAKANDFHVNWKNQCLRYALRVAYELPK